MGLPAQEQALLAGFGARLRHARKNQNLSQIAVAEQAEIARATLQRAELGAPAVSIGTYLRILRVLGFEHDVARLVVLDAADASGLEVPSPARRRSASAARERGRARGSELIRVRDYPQLHRLAWQLSADAELTPAEALSLYERNWRYVDAGELTAAERRLIERLKAEHGRGVMLV